MRSKILSAALVILFLFSASACKKKLVVPAELLGIWKTADSKYEGCFFEIKEDSLVIKTIEGSVDLNTITSLKKNKKLSTEERSYYIILYTTPEKVENELSIYYYPNKKVIRFVNQEEITWTK